jgi:putative transposase
MRDDLRAELVVDALEMAVARRCPGPGLVHHSDQGSQYVSLLFGESCREADIEISMGCTSAHDNAVAESFFASLTKDLLRRHILRNRAKHAPQSSTTSRPSTTRSGSTPRSTTCRPSTTKK